MSGATRDKPVAGNRKGKSEGVNETSDGVCLFGCQTAALTRAKDDEILCASDEDGAD